MSAAACKKCKHLKEEHYRIWGKCNHPSNLYNTKETNWYDGEIKIKPQHLLNPSKKNKYLDCSDFEMKWQYRMIECVKKWFKYST